MAFILTPPLVVKDQTAFAILLAGDMELPESLVISMATWSALQLLDHWRAEIGLLVSGARDKCCIVSGLASINSATAPSEWWKMYLRGEEAKLQYQTLLVNGANNWGEPSTWWRNISPYSVSSSSASPLSEWQVPRSDLADWCTHCDVLMNAIKAVEAD